jgi:hypothetical protein
MIHLLQAKDEEGVYHLGAVTSPDNLREPNFDALWDEWFGTFDTEHGDYPDSFSQFADWLIEQKGFQRADAEIWTTSC